MAKLFICGDIANMSSQNNFIGEDIAKHIKSADYSIGNLEGPEKSKNMSLNCPAQLSGTIKHLRDSGFNMMLLANNHITELGRDGLSYTINQIKENELEYIGAGLSWNETYKSLVKDIAGIKFGFINICEAHPGVFKEKSQEFGFAWMGYSSLFSDIAQLSSKVDFLIVFVHAGLEHCSIPLPEFRDFYHRLCDAGASVVIGGHTHSSQGYEYYGKKLVCYSLGNFFFPRNNGTWEEENSSYSIVLDFDKKGIIKITPIYHRLKNNYVNCSKPFIDLNDLCNQLNNKYLERANQMCINTYDSLCSKLLASATLGELNDTGLWDILKNALKITLLRWRYVNKTQKIRNSLLLHLFENESYRYTIIRALKNI